MSFRPIAAEDLDAALSLNNASAAELSLLDRPGLERLVGMARLTAWRGDAMLVALDQSAPYESPNHAFFRRRYASFLYVDRVAIAPGARRTGVGSQLYRHVIAEARRAGVPRVCCEVNVEPPNEASRAFHRRLGFAPVAEAVLSGGKRVEYLVLELPASRAVPAVRRSGRVAVVAPSGPFDEQPFQEGLALLSSRYEVVLADAVRARHRYLAGTDAVRGEGVQRAFDDGSITAVMAARGGYGFSRLLRRFTPRQKLLVGFSDVTAGLAAMAGAGWRSIHGPVVTQLGRLPPQDVQRLWDAMEGGPLAPLSGERTVVPGVARGPLVGGNLSLLAHLVGTGYLPPWHGCVLLLEDVGERPYRLDRLWTQLRLSGALSTVAGVALGQLTGCDEKDAGYTADEVMEELAAELGVPCAAGFPVGHGARNAAVPLGATVELDASERVLRFAEGAVS